jgi:peptidoglycan/LPS O-acetylase OafA/YrhL
LDLLEPHGKLTPSARVSRLRAVAIEAIGNPIMGRLAIMTQLASESGVRAADAPRTERNVAFDYLRSFGVLLVLLHHAALAYVTFGFLNPYDFMQTFSPVVDGLKWVGFDRIVLVNDTFFMPLLFFVSGLFVWTGLQKRGVFRFLGARFLRLGLPFVVGLLLIIPVAYYPTVLENGLVFEIPVQGFGAFWLDYIRGGLNPPGPLWFVWLLLSFDLLVALWYGFLRMTGLKSTRTSSPLLDNPLLFAATLVGLSFAAYLPMRIAFAPGQWGGTGPLWLEIVRAFWYLLYFGMGVAVGARGLNRGAFRSDGPFARYWWAWLLAGAGSYGFLTWIFSSPDLASKWGMYVFLVEAALVVLGLTALFLRMFRKPIRVLDNLSRCSYGMYLLHYLVIIWLQYAVLRAKIALGWKFAIVFVGGVAICWAATAALRRISGVRKII